MSHYCVAVFSNSSNNRSFDELLAPYSETDEKYFKFVPVENPTAKYEKYKNAHPESPIGFDEYFEDYCGYTVENGVYGRRCNPNAKWDWYTLDGKDYMFDPKEGETTEEYRYRKNQLNFRPEVDVRKQSAFWDHYVNGEPISEGIDGIPPFFRKEYYLRRYGTKEQFLKEMSIVYPYAFVTPDGTWHSPGDVGWFGCSDENAETMNSYLEEWFKFLEDPSNPYVSLVDCHI